MLIYALYDEWDECIIYMTDSLEDAIKTQRSYNNTQILEYELGKFGHNVVKHTYYLASFDFTKSRFAFSRMEKDNINQLNMDVPSYEPWSSRIVMNVSVPFGVTPDINFIQHRAVTIFSDWLKARAHKIPKDYLIFCKALQGDTPDPQFVTDSYGRICKIC